MGRGRDTDQEEHPLLVTLPGQLLEAALPDKLPTGLDQIVIANLKFRTHFGLYLEEAISFPFLYVCNPQHIIIIISSADSAPIALL